MSIELEFLKSLWGLGTEEEEGYRTGPPGYIGWRNSFLGIDSGAPYTFKNTGWIPSLAESIPRSRFLGFLNVYKYGLRVRKRGCLQVY
jgi:hypothetical protein